MPGCSERIWLSWLTGSCLTKSPLTICFVVGLSRGTSGLLAAVTVTSSICSGVCSSTMSWVMVWPWTTRRPVTSTGL